MLIRFLLLWLFTSAVAGHAGPWPRGEGDTFLSFGTSVSTPTNDIGADLQSYTSVYFERGMRRSLTFGLDGGVSDAGAFAATAFLRMPLFENSDTHRFAVRLGVGTLTDSTVTQNPSAMIGGSWGRGFTSPMGAGWVTVEAQAHYLFNSSDVIAKVDTTLGIKPNDRLKLMLQLQTGDYPGSEPYVRLAPSVAWAIREGRHIEFGAQIGLVGDDRVGVKLGTWLEF